MTISTTTQTLYDGERRAVIQGTGLTVNGATPNNLTLDTLVDISTLTPKASEVRVEKIEGDIGYGVVEIYWAAPVPVRFAVLSGSKVTFDYDSFGGMRMPDDGTGDILISTIGFDLASTYMVKLDLIKRLA